MGRWSPVSRTTIAACLVRSSRYMIPGSCHSTAHIEYLDRLLMMNQGRELPPGGLVIGRHDQGFLDPIAGPEHIAPQLELTSQFQIRLRMTPTRGIDGGGGGLLEELRR